MIFFTEFPNFLPIFLYFWIRKIDFLKIVLQVVDSEMENFKSKHLYITKKLYICSVVKNDTAVKWSELRRIAEEKGWYLLRNGSNHDIYAHPDNPNRIMIGRHGKEEIPNGTFSKLKKQIGL